MHSDIQNQATTPANAGMSQGQGAAPGPGMQPPTTPVLGTQYTQGYLQTQIGKKVRVEFLIGTGQLQDRTGILLKVGISYLIIREEETDDMLLCDLYSIKFVTFYA